MYRFTLLILLFSCLSLQAQYSYTRLEAEEVANPERSIYRLSSKDSICISINGKGGKARLMINDFVHETGGNDEELEYAVFGNAKEKRAVVLLNRRAEVSLGCDMFIINGKGGIFCGSIPVAAYTKTDKGRMDYNSILPYISIIRVSNRYVLSFETPLVVLYPFGDREEILNGRSIFYTYQNGALELNR